MGRWGDGEMGRWGGGEVGGWGVGRRGDGEMGRILLFFIKGHGHQAWNGHLARYQYFHSQVEWASCPFLVG
ncbi:hypothetical protein [Moorena sp. SIO4G3]|uniref:hypothetical protein n=1 Tax=Moorena sp. SIO4G3 TaxID=2607821 RepID=UPI00142D1572|nr:hypothetical protein [Moorena sp. SIO4G3]NEO80694.1 hypothetical protein [Moorena sp. SIO4G3]